MRHAGLIVLVATCALLISGTQAALAQTAVSGTERAQLVQRLSSFDSCNADCAKNLAVLIVDGGVASALVVAGVVKGSEKLKSEKMHYLSLYAVLRKVWASGGDIIDTYKVCAQTCDSLYHDVVELGRSGLLGPIADNTPVPETWFNDPKVKAIWNSHFKPRKPVNFPPQFHNDAKWKMILNTA